MVYTYRRVTCPNCGKTADRKTIKDGQTLWGSPFRVCPKCQATYFDPEYKEQAITFYNQKGEKNSIGALIFVVLLHLIALGCLILFCTSLYNDYGGEAKYIIIFIPALILAIVLDQYLIENAKQRRYMKQNNLNYIDALEGRAGDRDVELKASMARLQSRAYLDALKSHGVFVPQYFYDRIDENDEVIVPLDNIDFDINKAMKNPKVSIETKETEEALEEKNSGEDMADETEPTKTVVSAPQKDTPWKKISVALGCLLLAALIALAVFIPYVSNYSTILKFSEVSIGQSKSAEYWADPHLLYLTDEEPEKVIEVYVGDDDIYPEVACENGKVSVSTTSIDHNDCMMVTLKKRSNGVAMVKFTDINNPSTAFYVVAICK